MIQAISPFQMQSVKESQNQDVQNNNQTQQTSFSDFLTQSINEVNSMQVKSDQMTAALAKGKNVQLQDVMIATEKASVTMLATIEIRNKAVEAYQEMMRMQM
ncbi:flagellar hook-basal body complex protein FliE [Bacillus sp. V2I10]|uniref:flagellar hook-basal body complex protein FliE n=1 Tax=Bacillus sp. V2I10 TaxID=3042276 RepID=UPI0027869661|nr:flagellar hook-basal body complex protein FliE [Bacillus sp. V2I10]MDQ0860130.1 flagellar hook-basal body complex protein FliE [Bacillus sp. V2I10]